ncbi:MAG: fructosamine kinase family protein [Chloroflexi bacterium]|nr:fructosamine kinase family protein [Chloroflexota bacterium]
MAMRAELKGKIEQIAGQTIRAAQPLTGGKISQTLRIDLNDGESLVAKVGDGSHDLRIEGFMLRYLRSHSQLPVPIVHHEAHDLLLMEYIAGESRLDDQSLRHLGLLLATCHQITSPAYGLDRDTLIGPWHQPNAPSPAWIPFFREQRLLYMVGVARESGRLPSGLEVRLQTFADALASYLVEPDQPALIHGDMWRTNVLARGGRVCGVIDPALYFAHHEVELAYMTLFDGVGEAFFSAYQEQAAIDSDFFKVRRHIYNLYPLLVHVTIFGAKYLPPLHAALERFGF